MSSPCCCCRCVHWIPDWARECDEWPQTPKLWPKVVTLGRWGFCQAPDLNPEEIDGEKENRSVLCTRHDACCPCFLMRLSEGAD